MFPFAIFCDFDNQTNSNKLAAIDHSLKHLSRIMRKQTFCICENKDEDQLRANREADQRLCFRFIGSAIPLLSKSEISSLYPSSVAAQPGLCRTRSETRMLVFSRRGSFMCYQSMLRIARFLIMQLQLQVFHEIYTLRL